ncbi:hypothetical protein M409DRAFT_52412 [Zasmidium cellare ATCC 36951]|uniref:Cercosporin MFS transporter CTB4 n=1 Tax=Zasmidium cellare ATCC 36951 TaxID=1080233 RepID=A0A6A6CPR1_ZASCE|nr:uncharacterized protein M409DRAFT_52412 [Zasmidium cellare ATCC 36951]KAF2169124.1 hypothetical protein M409DRAFT_52412 [Zasmidium cellare ATCC 36951]
MSHEPGETSSPLEKLEKIDTATSQKPAELVPDVESILEAIEVGSADDGEPDEKQNNKDLEKAPTRASRASSKKSRRSVTTAQDWDGPDDPENPYNWSTWKKMRHFWPTAFLAFAVTVGSSLISPANQALQEAFHVSRTAAIVPLTVFVVGLGLGPLIAAPLSEMYGRTIVYKITAPIYILFLAGAGESKTFGSLVVCRFLAGVAGAPVLAVGAGTNADMFLPRNRAPATSTFIMMPFLGPSMGPLIGGFAVYFKNWQWTVWANIIIAGFAFLTCLPMSETYKKIVLQKRAKRHGLPPPPGPNARTWKYWKTLFSTTLIRPGHMLFTEPIVILFAIYNAFTFCVQFAFFPAFPLVFGGVYGFNTWQTGLAYLGLGIGVLLAALTAMLTDRFIYRKKHAKAQAEGKGQVAPEERLWAGMLGAVGLPIGLFWFAWTARSDVHWISPILAGIPFAWGNLALFLSASMYQIDVYGPLNGASAMAANGLLRYVLGGCFPLWTVQMYEAMGIGWATSLLGFICVLLLPIPYVFYKFGPGIRKSSRYSVFKN